MKNIEQTIRMIEDANARRDSFRSNQSSVVNPILVELGGKPICKDSTAPAFNDGSDIFEIYHYMTLLSTRKLLAELDK